MKDKEKQIEEMAKEMCKVCLEVEKPCYMKNQPCSLIKKEAEELYNAGYRKITDDLVVLNKDEYSNLIKPTLKSIEVAIAKFTEQEAKKKFIKLAKVYGIDTEVYE